MRRVPGSALWHVPGGAAVVHVGWAVVWSCCGVRRVPGSALWRVPAGAGVVHVGCSVLPAVGCLFIFTASAVRIDPGV